MRHRCLAIIPARSGSKGIKNKNIKDLSGKPLIYYTIKEAEKSKLINKVVVSTDSKKIAQIAIKFGVDVPFLRPKSLARDTTSMFPVIKHAVSFLEGVGEKFDIIVILQPTSPLRTSRDIDRAIHKLMKTRADSIVTVCPVEYSPYWMKVIKNGRIRPFIKSKTFFRRQDSPDVYRLNGAIYVTKRNTLVREKSILGRDTRALIMKQDDSLDIDTELDFKLAELILKNKNEENKNRK